MAEIATDKDPSKSASAPAPNFKPGTFSETWKLPAKESREFIVELYEARDRGGSIWTLGTTGWCYDTARIDAALNTYEKRLDDFAERVVGQAENHKVVEKYLAGLKKEAAQIGITETIGTDIPLDPTDPKNKNLTPEQYRQRQQREELKLWVKAFVRYNLRQELVNNSDTKIQAAMRLDGEEVIERTVMEQKIGADGKPVMEATKVQEKEIIPGIEVFVRDQYGNASISNITDVDRILYACYGMDPQVAKRTIHDVFQHGVCNHEHNAHLWLDKMRRCDALVDVVKAFKARYDTDLFKYLGHEANYDWSGDAFCPEQYYLLTSLYGEEVGGSAWKIFSNCKFYLGGLNTTTDAKAVYEEMRRICQYNEKTKKYDHPEKLVKIAHAFNHLFKHFYSTEEFTFIEMLQEECGRGEGGYGNKAVEFYRAREAEVPPELRWAANTKDLTQPPAPEAGAATPGTSTSPGSKQATPTLPKLPMQSPLDLMRQLKDLYRSAAYASDPVERSEFLEKAGGLEEALSRLQP